MAVIPQRFSEMPDPAPQQLPDNGTLCQALSCMLSGKKEAREVVLAFRKLESRLGEGML